jgi:hypothetical protein
MWMGVDWYDEEVASVTHSWISKIHFALETSNLSFLSDLLRIRVRSGQSVRGVLWRLACCASN